MGKKASQAQEFFHSLENNLESDIGIDPMISGHRAAHSARSCSLISGLKASKSGRRKQQKQKRRLLKKKLPIINFMGQSAKKDVETVVFEDPDKVWQKEKQCVAQDKKDLNPHKTNTENEFDIRKSRFEIMKFSMQSMQGSEKEDAETNLAMSLGAEAPKKPYINYKTLQEIRKSEIQLKKSEEQSLRKPNLQIKKSNNVQKTRSEIRKQKTLKSKRPKSK